MDQSPGASTAGDWDDTEFGDGRSDAELLNAVWRNEKVAPEILPVRTPLVQRIRERIELVERSIMELEGEGTQELVLSMYRMDLNRIQFLLRSYLRTRLSKIEKHVLYVGSSPETFDRLSAEEKRYAERYSDVLEKHLHYSVLNRLPEGYRSMLRQVDSNAEVDMMPTPKLDTYVFCRSKDNIGSIQLDEKGDETVDMTPDDLHIVRYSAVRKLAEKDRVDFV